MADLQFEEQQFARAGGYGPKRSWLTALIIKMGLAKDDAGAQKALVVILILTLIAIALIWIL